MQMLHIQPLPDDRFRFRIEDEGGDKVICEVSGAIPGPRSAHSVEERETAALERSLDLTRALRRAIRERMLAPRS
jgi:hypothetical protein